ncbi:RNA methyltransferase [Candidatus Amarolinea dominans]|uniref:RNA methyltransferase n=1 Tax=Candidatus Amarolinea dominans TaxID=3140696 RepID=UPI003135A886|nr:RNA methyltransferase [Anaerolineae bacterium]
MLAPERVVIVLVEPQDAVNVGAVLRVMLNFGLRQLRVVNPAAAALDPARLDDLAHRSQAIIAGLQVTSTLDEALADATYVVGATARPREEALAAHTPRELAPIWVAQMQAGRLALVFGPESSGLTNAALDRCHVRLTIPTTPDYRSLNLAQAVLIVCYELWLAADDPAPTPTLTRPADAAALVTMFADWQQALTAIGFLKPGQAPVMMRRLRDLVQRAAPSAAEARLLHAIAREMLKFARRLT